MKRNMANVKKNMRNYISLPRLHQFDEEGRHLRIYYHYLKKGFMKTTEKIKTSHSEAAKQQ